MILDSLDQKTISAESLTRAHWQLGSYLKKDIHHYINNNLLKKNPDLLQKELQKMSQIKTWIQNKINDSSSGKEVLKTASDSYFECLMAWADGAEIGKLLKNDNLQQIENFALLLQNDNVGCQTSFIRYKEEILIWHVEEDIMNTVRRSRMMTFDIANKEETETQIHFFVYPHLLPGAGFAFSKNYFQAIDFLSVDTKLEIGSLSNFLVWISLFYGDKNNPEDLIAAFLPSLDGYALNYLKSNGNEVDAKKILFAGHKIDIEKLKTTDLEYVYQNNFLLNNRNTVHSYFFDPKNQRAIYTNRQQNFEEFYKTIKDVTDIPQLLLNLFKLTVFCDAQGSKPDYIPNHIKSFVFGFFSPKKALYYVGSSFDQTEATNAILDKKIDKKFIEKLHRIII